MIAMRKYGVIIANLGSPDSPNHADVRRYLGEFLMDPYVIDLPFFLRWILVKGIIIPFRYKKTSEAYKSIWTDKGSPLIYYGAKLAQEIKLLLPNTSIELAMRYGHPSIESALLKLENDPEIHKIIVFPLYPHYAMSTIKSLTEHIKQLGTKYRLKKMLQVFPTFYDHPDYIHCLTQTIMSQYKPRHYDHIIFSFHSVPLRHIYKDDSTKKHCCKQLDCCIKPSSAWQTCYRHQVFRTIECVVNNLNLNINQYSVTFQSRVGKAKWLTPTTVDTLRELANNKKTNVLIVCPSFTADCLETLEEIALQARDIFLEAGGEKLDVVPCLNDHPDWARIIVKWLNEFSKTNHNQLNVV